MKVIITTLIILCSGSFASAQTTGTIKGDRRLILNRLWGNDNFFNSRNLDVYITKLRAYLKADSNLQIITVKGVGYRFGFLHC